MIWLPEFSIEWVTLSQLLTMWRYQTFTRTAALYTFHVINGISARYLLFPHNVLQNNVKLKIYLHLSID